MSIQKLKFDRKAAHIVSQRPFSAGDEHPSRSKTIVIAPSLSIVIAAVNAIAPYDIIPMGWIQLRGLAWGGMVTPPLRMQKLAALTLG